MTLKFVSIVFFCLSNLSFGQLDQDYIPVKSAGEIPPEFRSLILENADEQYDDKVGEQDTEFEKSVKSYFLLSSNWFLQRILTSGKVLFGEPISNYVSEVGNQFLVNEPDLKDKVKFYVLKSTAVNAFATDQGMIFVTTGLLARLENEAQLAFVLAHELSHIKKNHSINEYVNNQKMLHSKVQNSHKAFDLAVQSMAAYSKQNELEADALGAELYSNTEYAPAEMMNTMDVLAYSYLGFGDDKIDLNKFGADHYIIPDTLIIREIRAIDFDEEYDDTYASHPNIFIRKTRLDSIISKSPTNTKNYIISEDLFQEIRELSRFEVVRLNLINGSYERGLFHIMFLQKTYPNNSFLKTERAKAFYGLFKIKLFIAQKNKKNNFDKRIEIEALELASFGDQEKTQGEEHKLVGFLSKLNARQLAAFSLYYFLEEPQTKDQYKRYQNDILNDLFTEYPNLINRMRTKTDYDVRNDSFLGLGDEELRLKYFEDFHLYILNAYLNDPNFKNTVKESKQIWDEEKGKAADLEAYLAIKKNVRKRDKWEGKYGNNLGIDSIITVTPYYFKTSEKNGTNYIGTEQMQLNYTQIIEKKSDDVQLKNEILNPLLFNSGEVDKYNDLSIINECLTECFDISNYGMIPLSSDYAAPIQAKHGTSKILFSGVINNILRKNIYQTASVVVFSAVVFPLLPIAVFYAANPAHETILFNFVIDIQTGEIQFAEVEYFEKQLDSPLFLESQIHNKLFRIKNDPKKELTK